MSTIKVLKTGQEIDLNSDNIHKYWEPQGVFLEYGKKDPSTGSVFIVQEEVDRPFDGYAVNVDTKKGTGPVWVMFWKETVLKFGKRKQIPGKFNDKPFFSISLTHKDGIGLA